MEKKWSAKSKAAAASFSASTGASQPTGAAAFRWQPEDFNKNKKRPRKGRGGCAFHLPCTMSVLQIKNKIAKDGKLATETSGREVACGGTTGGSFVAYGTNELVFLEPNKYECGISAIVTG